MSDTKLKQQQSVLMNKDERKLAVLEAQKAKEKSFKLVVKIISWESGAVGSVVVQAENKITEQEWLQYRKQRLSIATPEEKSRAEQKLTLTYNSIKANGGFEKN